MFIIHVLLTGRWRAWFAAPPREGWRAQGAAICSPCNLKAGHQLGGCNAKLTLCQEICPRRLDHASNVDGIHNCIEASLRACPPSYDGRTVIA